MLVKLCFPALSCDYPDVDMLRCNSNNTFATECILPRRPKRSLPPLPEDKEFCNGEYKSSTIQRKRKHRKQCLKLPALPEHDEC